MKIKRSHGWIRQNSGTKGFVKLSGGESRCIGGAFVFLIRKEARESITPYRLNTDVVRMVSLAKNGKAKKIIGRG